MFPNKHITKKKKHNTLFFLLWWDTVYTEKNKKQATNRTKKHFRRNSIKTRKSIYARERNPFEVFELRLKRWRVVISHKLNNPFPLIVKGLQIVVKDWKKKFISWVLFAETCMKNKSFWTKRSASEQVSSYTKNINTSLSEKKR